jgi:restriction endonuclease
VTRLSPSIAAIGSPQEKGRALERAVGAVWTQLGYRKLKFNVHATGEEIDIEGIHVVSAEVLKGQCKAHSAKIDTGPLRQFFGDVEKERGRSERLTGIFVSLSGFSGTAERWHEELLEKQRAYFKKFDGDEFLTQLEEAALICSVESLTARVHELTKLDVTRIELLLTERGPFWRITLGDATKSAAYHAFLSASASTPRREDIEYLEARAVTAATSRVSFSGRESLIRLLLRDAECELQDIPSRTAESPEDIRAATDSLIAEGLLTLIAGRTGLRQELDAVLAIARLSLGTDIQLDFMKSAFYRDCLRPILLPFVEAKHSMKFAPEETDIVVKILSVSPLALKRMLTGDAELFRNTEKEIQRLKFQEPEAERHRRASRVMLLDRLIHDLMSDHVENHTSPLFAHYEIIVTKTSIELKLGKRKESFLMLNSSWFTQMATAGETIKAGEFVFADGPGPILEGADAKMAINEWASAIESYEAIIAHWADTEAAAASANNKGVCLLNLGRVDEAIEILHPLLKNQQLRQYVLPNLARCYAKNGLEEQARKMIDELAGESGNPQQLVRLRSEIDQLLGQIDRRN